MNKCCEKIVDIKKISHDEWLDTRRTGIGGSDSSTIVGLNPYNSPYALYLDKIGDCAEKPDNEAMRQGRDFEQYVADRWMEATGKKCRRNNFMWRSTRWPYMLADIDREIVGENAGLECKTTSVFNKSDLAGGEIPQTYYVQCQHYMAVLGFDRMYLAVLVLNRGFYHFVIERDEAEIEALAAAEGEFWQCITNQQPPEVDGSEATVNAIKKQYPEAAADLPMMELEKALRMILPRWQKSMQTSRALKIQAKRSRPESWPKWANARWRQRPDGTFAGRTRAAKASTARS